MTALNLVLELSSSRARLGEDSTAIAPGVAVDQVDTFLQGVDPHADQDWTEDLFFVASHRGCNVVDDGRGDEVALWELRMNVVAAV